MRPALLYHPRADVISAEISCGPLAKTAKCGYNELLQFKIDRA